MATVLENIGELQMMNEKRPRAKEHTHTVQTHTFEALEKVNRQKFVHEHAPECLAASMFGTNYHLKHYSIQIIHVGFSWLACCDYLSYDLYLFYLYNVMKILNTRTPQFNRSKYSYAKCKCKMENWSDIHNQKE